MQIFGGEKRKEKKRRKAKGTPLRGDSVRLPCALTGAARKGRKDRKASGAERPLFRSSRGSSRKKGRESPEGRMREENASEGISGRKNRKGTVRGDRWLDAGLVGWA